MNRYKKHLGNKINKMCDLLDAEEEQKDKFYISGICSAKKQISAEVPKNAWLGKSVRNIRRGWCLRAHRKECFKKNVVYHVIASDTRRWLKSC